MKVYRVVATFPELPAVVAQQEAEGSGGKAITAICTALSKIFSRPALRYRRITHVKISAFRLQDRTPSELHPERDVEHRANADSE